VHITSPIRFPLLIPSVQTIGPCLYNSTIVVLWQRTLQVQYLYTPTSGFGLSAVLGATLLRLSPFLNIIVAVTSDRNITTTYNHASLLRITRYRAQHDRIYIVQARDPFSSPLTKSATTRDTKSTSAPIMKLVRYVSHHSLPPFPF